MRFSVRWGLATALGAVVLFGAVVAFPAIAGSDGTPSIEAIAKPGAQYENERYSWAPETVSIAPTGAVNFANNTPGVAHGIVWKEVPATPSCSGVPIEKGEEGWKGSCTFPTAGTYNFRCFVYPEMKGTVTVVGGVVFTTVTTSTRTHTPGENSSSPFAGGSSKSVVLASSQHGSTIKGSVDIGEQGAKGKLTIELVAKVKGHSTVVGKATRGGLKTGVVSFSASLNAAGKKALKSAHTLAVTVKIMIKPAFGAGVKVTHAVKLHG